MDESLSSARYGAGEDYNWRAGASSHDNDYGIGGFGGFGARPSAGSFGASNYGAGARGWGATGDNNYGGYKKTYDAYYDANFGADLFTDPPSQGPTTTYGNTSFGADLFDDLPYGNNDTTTFEPFDKTYEYDSEAAARGVKLVCLPEK